MTPHQFIEKWKQIDLSERSACQSHFLDLCELLGQPKPTDADPTGEWYTFEKGVDKDTGGQGFADVWRRGFFGWEYKKKKKNLVEAYRQLSQYREALANPPLLIVCDLNRFEIHTNFTGTVKEVRAFDLDGLTDPKNVQLLRYAFTDPDQFKPGKTQKKLTEEVAETFAKLALGMQARNIEPHRAGHFLMKLMFCMFAEDIELLPKSLFLRTVKGSRWDAKKLTKLLKSLFEAMAQQNGTFGADEIAWFNGGLFADVDVIELTPTEIRHLANIAEYDWSNVEPSIFGTLFERILDPNKRGQLGAHYTSREDIETLLRPVLLDSLKREWDIVRGKADKLWEKVKGKSGRLAFERCVNDFHYRLTHVTVLDPACGSGNFLYVALHMLLDLEKEVLTYMAEKDQRQRFPNVRPTQLLGLEINPYAQELAQVSIWIGFHQWVKFNGFLNPVEPVLEPMENIRCQDSILDLTDPENPTEPEWPDAEFIVGNPPFLGGKMLRRKLGDKYVDALFGIFGDRLQRTSDLCCYWFEKAREKIEQSQTKRAGLLATQGIRGVSNRGVLKRIKKTGDIFFAISDRDWILDGAAVHISMVGFDDGTDKTRLLDGKVPPEIHANLSGGVDVTKARKLKANRKVGFMGDTKGGPFELRVEEAIPLLRLPNVNGRPSSDVILPWCNGEDATDNRAGEWWIVDFPLGCSKKAASHFDSVYGHVQQKAEASRGKSRSIVSDWWLHERPRPDMRRALKPLARFIATPNLTKHRLFLWLELPTLPDHQTIVFARSDDFFFGVLHSKPHELWSLRMGTQLEDRPRYTPTTCFGTFPFPEATDDQRDDIAAAAQELDTLRTNWLNPPEWTKTEVLEFPGSVDGPWRSYVQDVDPVRGIGTVRYPRIVPKNAECARKLRDRTLTELYNERPAWLAAVHAKLDAAVFTAYGWPADLSDADLLARLLTLNLSRPAK